MNALNARQALPHLALLLALACPVSGQSGDAPPQIPAPRAVDEPERHDFDALKARGARASSYLTSHKTDGAGVAPGPDLASFRDEIEPLLFRSCLPCHGPERERGGVRVDSLDPDMVHGDDVEWWLDVLSVLSNGEMPPEGEAELPAEERGRVIEWLAKEVQTASRMRRAAGQHSSFRRLTRYEYEYVLQDLLGLPYSFADDLPPDPASEDGFLNSSDVLHLSQMQLRAYLDSNRKALRAATIHGERPAPMYWDVSMDAAAAIAWARQDQQIENLRKKHAEDPEALDRELGRLRERFAKRPNGAHYEALDTGRFERQSWQYGGAKFAWKPTSQRPGPARPSSHVGVLPKGQGMIVELGEKLPEEGTLRVSVLAARATAGPGAAPSLQLAFGWQASNDSRAVVRVSEQDLVVDAPPEAPERFVFEVPLRELRPRNGVRTTARLGDLPSPSEYIKLVNASHSGGAIHLHHVEVTAPVYAQWPPASHLSIFPRGVDEKGEQAYAQEILADFMPRAWRREVHTSEIERKLEFFGRIRAEFDSFEDAMLEVLATVLSSPHFLYVAVGASPTAEEPERGPMEAALATRLSMFLWCSAPDDELLTLARDGRLSDPDILRGQVERLLTDPRSRRFSKHFTRQWLGLSLLDYLHVDRKAYPRFDPALREALAEEPIAFFHEVLSNDMSALEFLHSDFTMANERLAQHYGLGGVEGNHLRRVEWGALDDDGARGGLLTQAGLLAMNSDGKDSHPLKRGVWLLERLLNDPPPPPPPAVPEIDLADPEIAKLTLKQRIENHRDHPACMSCHAKIDPWGIAFENYDAIGSWRTEVRGRPIDARSLLFNGQELDGVSGLKRFLLENRQDQFVRAMVHKLTTYALGRPLTFEDRAAVDAITSEVRGRGDGLATMITLIATSELFRSS